MTNQLLGRVVQVLLARDADSQGSPLIQTKIQEVEYIGLLPKCFRNDNLRTVSTMTIICFTLFDLNKLLLC